jgi:hypothetical protein
MQGCRVRPQRGWRRPLPGWSASLRPLRRRALRTAVRPPVLILLLLMLLPLVSMLLHLLWSQKILPLAIPLVSRLPAVPAPDSSSSFSSSSSTALRPQKQKTRTEPRRLPAVFAVELRERESLLRYQMRLQRPLAWKDSHET